MNIESVEHKLQIKKEITFSKKGEKEPENTTQHELLEPFQLDKEHTDLTTKGSAKRLIAFTKTTNEQLFQLKGQLQQETGRKEKFVTPQDFEAILSDQKLSQVITQDCRKNITTFLNNINNISRFTKKVHIVKMEYAYSHPEDHEARRDFLEFKEAAFRYFSTINDHRSINYLQQKEKEIELKYMRERSTYNTEAEYSFVVNLKNELEKMLEQYQKTVQEEEQLKKEEKRLAKILKSINKENKKLSKNERKLEVHNVV